MRKTTFLLPIVVIVVVGFMSSIFVVDEREKALVLQFGQIKAVKDNPGLAFKVPLIQEVVRYDDRILSIDTDPIEVTPSDDRRLVVDAFARYRIADVVQFRQAVGVGGVRSAESRLGSILTTQVREVLGADGVTSNTILSADRATLMNRIRDQARIRAAALGLEVVDVRLKQTNLPVQNLDATFARMRAEREREAADEIARGEEAAQRIRAQADRTVVELVSDAQREAEITRGEADARRNAVYAEAFGQDPGFFEFYRSLTAYERAMQGDNSTLVMSPNSEFFTYFHGSGALTPEQVAQAALDSAEALAAEGESTIEVPDAEAPAAEAEATETGADTGSTAADAPAAADTATDAAAEEPAAGDATDAPATDDTATDAAEPATGSDAAAPADDATTDGTVQPAQ